MHNILAVRGSDTRANRGSELQSARGRHDFLFRENVLERLSVYVFHHQKRHSAAHYTKICDSNNVLMTNRGSRQCFLPETSNQHWIVSHQIGQDYFDGVRRLEENMTRLKNNTHASLAQTLLELIASVKYWFPQQRRRGGIAVLRTVVYVIGETAPTGWAFFHLLLYGSGGGDNNALLILTAIL
jgi:hypothetical protein